MYNLTLTDPRVLEESRAYAEKLGSEELVAVLDNVLSQKRKTKVVDLIAIKASNKCKIKKCLVDGEECIVKINRDAKVTKNEIQNLTQLKHKSIVLLRNVLSLGGQTALVLELGKPVQSLLSSELNTRESQLKPIMRQILEGIAYIHAKGYVHGDIKPSNMISVSDQAKIIDFGGGVKIVSGSLYHFQYTTSYLALDQLKRIMSNHSIKVTYALDIWAYGISLYELIVGEHPFHDLMVNVDEDEQKGSIVELIESGITFPTTMSEAAKDLIHKCLNENPLTRCSANELLYHPFFIKEEPI